MTKLQHALSNDLPELKEVISALKQSDAHFSRLLESYDDLTHQVEAIESGVTPVEESFEQELKIKRVHLKDELVAILNK